VLIEPSCELILEKLEEHRIDLLIGGMLELPLARARGIDHIDMMHGSQKTVGPAGAANLVRLCGRRRALE
jgi:nitrogenase molybdenum-iron protein alpha/beta subunit